MRSRTRLAAIGAAVAATATMAIGAGTATAAFPNLADCPRTAPNVALCVDIQSRSGYLDIKGFRVPIGESLEIRGGFIPAGDGTGTFVPPAGTDGFFGRPIQVPGGILGIDFPIPGNAVRATATLAGPPSAIRINTATSDLSVPVKLKLSNPLIGPLCRIGNDNNPVRLNLTTGTTNPPAPNRPISGGRGTLSFENGILMQRGNTNVDNAFAIPGASYCGLGLHLIDTLINAKLRIPSAAGNNTMVIVNDVALQGAAG